MRGITRDKLTVENPNFVNKIAGEGKNKYSHMPLCLANSCSLYAQVCIHRTLGSRPRLSSSRASFLPLHKIIAMRARILSISFANAFSYKETRRGNRKGRKDGARSRPSRVPFNKKASGAGRILGSQGRI